MADAEAAGDEILAVIRGVGVSNDRDCGLFAPAEEGQERAVRAAYAHSGWSPAIWAMLNATAPAPHW